MLLSLQIEDAITNFINNDVNRLLSKVSPIVALPLPSPYNILMADFTPTAEVTSWVAPLPPATTAEVRLVYRSRNGSRAKADIDTAMKAAGISGVKAAAAALRVMITEGRPGCWFWRLPDGFDLSRYPASPEPPLPTLLDDLPGEGSLEPGAKPKPKRRTARGRRRTCPARSGRRAADGRDPECVAEKVGRVRKALDGCGFTFPRELTASPVEQYLATLTVATRNKKAEGKAARTLPLAPATTPCKPCY